jgi:hypothetical protein
VRAALSAAQVEALRRQAEQAQVLLSTGAIGEAEHRQLLALFWQLNEADRSADAVRTQVALKALNGLLALADARPLQGEMMDANVILKQIDEAAAVMAAQMRALNCVAPVAPVIAAGTQNAGSMFDACLQANWVGLGNSLTALAQAESEVRVSLALPPAARGSAGAALPADEVIDVEAREVPPATSLDGSGS